MARESKLEAATRRFNEQMQWVTDHGGTREGYIARYAPSLERVRPGETDDERRASAIRIWNADITALQHLQIRLAELRARAARREERRAPLVPAWPNGPFIVGANPGPHVSVAASLAGPDHDAGRIEVAAMAGRPRYCPQTRRGFTASAPRPQNPDGPIDASVQRNIAKSGSATPCGAGDLAAIARVEHDRSGRALDVLVGG